ncbi:hypothetical protein [Streptomyces erythrochromogenes]|uniref:hypothetical protein n=1 Tax=Streptomyces erythrochromogenes TaxID=285574 RepID=UPI00369977E7
MDEDRARSSIAQRTREHIGWWLAAGAAIAGISALLISMTWPAEWRDNANSVCDKMWPKYSTALTEVEIAAREMIEKEEAAEKGGSPVRDADYQAAGRIFQAAASSLSEMLGEIRDLERPMWGNLDSQVETAVDRGSAIARSFSSAGQAQVKQKGGDAWSKEVDGEVGEHLEDAKKRMPAWLKSLAALKVDQCSSRPPD